MYVVIAMIIAFGLVMYLSIWITDSNEDTFSSSSDNNTRMSFLNGEMSWDFNEIFLSLLNTFGVPFTHYVISPLYTMYLRFIPSYALTIFKFKVIAVVFFKLLKYRYFIAQESLKQQQSKLEDIQLQVDIMHEKCCVKDTESKEHHQRLRLSTERLREVRGRLRGLIAADERARCQLEQAAAGLCDYLPIHSIPEEEQGLVVTLLTEEQPAPELLYDKMNCGEQMTSGSDASDASVYSSVEDCDCQVNIVKVTNVYKVKHYIKQKRLRRATQHALLKKKFESIKNVLDSWQKTLNMVINSKLLLDNSNTLDAISQEAMGDYSKPNIRESDSDSDLMKNNEHCFDDYSRRWIQNPYRHYGYNFEDIPESAVSKEYYESQEYNELTYSPHTTNLASMCECPGPTANVLFILPEETTSQMAIEEITDEPEQ